MEKCGYVPDEGRYVNGMKYNEPGFAPHSGKDENGNTVFPDFGEWFDNEIDDLMTQT